MSRRTVEVIRDEVLVYDLPAAAKVCSVSEDTLKEATKAGRLKGKRSGENGGGKYLYTRDELLAWYTGLVDA